MRRRPTAREAGEGRILTLAGPTALAHRVKVDSSERRTGGGAGVSARAEALTAIETITASALDARMLELNP
jgi:hypothetical protein